MARIRIEALERPAEEELSAEQSGKVVGAGYYYGYGAGVPAYGYGYGYGSVMTGGMTTGTVGPLGITNVQSFGGGPGFLGGSFLPAYGVPVAGLYGVPYRRTGR